MTRRSIQRDAWGIAGYALLGIVILAALVLGLASCGSRPALAHSWYPIDCCSDRDCWAMGTDADAREPDPTAVPGGWLTHDGLFIAHDETRPSRDGRFHVCRGGGNPGGHVVAPPFTPMCLFVPRPGA